MVEQWKARQCNIKLGDAVSSVVDGTELWTQVVEIQGIEQVAKDVELTTPEKDVETTFLLGEDVGGAQNDIVEDQDPTDAEFTGTLLGNLIDMEQFQLTASATPPSGFTRYNFGTDVPSAGLAVAVQFISGTSKVNFLMNNARVVQVGGFSQDAEGAAEAEFTIKCTPSNLYKESNIY